MQMKGFEETKKILEAALFMSPSIVRFEDLLRLSGNVLEFRKAMSSLMEDYQNRDGALELLESKHGFQMKVKEAYYNKVMHFASATEFSQSALKTLALIAYKQPILQANVIKYRTNKAYDDIKILEEKGFLSKHPSGKSYILRTTQKFLKYFGENPVHLRKLTPEELAKQALSLSNQREEVKQKD
jgi:segregation and condensation protein B